MSPELENSKPRPEEDHPLMASLTSAHASGLKPFFTVEFTDPQILSWRLDDESTIIASNIILMLCALYNAFVAPSELIFNPHHCSDCKFSDVVPFNVLVDVISWVTLYLWYRLQIAPQLKALFEEEDQKRTKNLKEVIRKSEFLESWTMFLLFFLGSVPLDYFGWLKDADLAHILRLNRLLQLPFVVVLKGRLENTMVLSCIGNIRLHLLYTFSLFFYIVHSVACLWWLHSRLEDFPQGDSDSDPWGPTDEIVDSSFSTQYLSSLLWAVKAFAGVITNEATTDSEKAVSIVVIIIGLIVLSYLIGEVCSCFVQSRIRELRYRQRMDTADDVLRQHECDDKLRARVHNYYSSMWQRRMTKDIKSIFSDLPPHVQQEIHYTLKFDFMRAVPFFRDLSDQMLGLVAACLDPCFAIKGDLIIKTGEVGMEMYFIIKGAVEVFSPGVGNVPEKVFAALTVGCYFGEKSIIRQETRNAHVRAKEDTEMMVLQKSDLDQVLEMNPEWKRALESSIRSRLWQSAGTKAGVSAPESALAATFRNITRNARDLREAESTRASHSSRNIAREDPKEEDAEEVIEKVDEISDSKGNNQVDIDEHSQP